MADAPTTADRALLDAARRGDESAYRRLVEPHRTELHAHCYRMLGSLHDAEDALQDALLRAWRGLPGFQGRGSSRAWLYRIATNACLDALARRPRRVLPVDHGPPSGPEGTPGEPLTESVWVEPYPDEQIGLEDGPAGPEARYERRESVELAFVAALQLLPPRQRAALVMRDVLGFSAREAAEQLQTSVPSLNSALQRARQTLEERLPDRSQQATLRALGDERAREIVARYSDAMERADVEAMVGMLAEDAAWSMPPLPIWYGGLQAVRGFLEREAFSVRWRHLPTRANGQLAVGCYALDDRRGAFVASVLDVITLRGDRIAEVVGFSTAEVFRGLVTQRRPVVPCRLFPAFGLPEEIA